MINQKEVNAMIDGRPYDPTAKETADGISFLPKQATEISLSHIPPEEFFNFCQSQMHGLAVQQNNGMENMIKNVMASLSAQLNEMIEILHANVQHAENELIGLRMLELHLVHGKLNQESWDKIAPVIGAARKIKADWAADRMKKMQEAKEKFAADLKTANGNSVAPATPQ